MQSLHSIIEEAASTGSDLGDPLVLEKYGAARYAPNFAMMSAMDSFARVFGTEFGPAVWARSTGFNVLESMPLAKKLIMRYAGTYPA